MNRAPALGLLAVLLAALAPALLGSEALPSPYERVSRSLEALAASGAREPLRIVVEVLVLGEGGREEGLAEREGARLAEALKTALRPGSGILAARTERRPFPALPAPSELSASAAPPTATEAALLAADDGALRGRPTGPGLLLVLRIVDYRSGGYDLYETTARLLDIQSGRELARDVSWTSLGNGSDSALFVDGSRLR